MTTSPTYRPDIDGLRAIAVLAVVAFHSSFDVLPGGFVGVDVFFVISGYLITGLIRNELKASRFSFRHFWLRRIRRLFTALFVVVITSLVVFAFVFPPNYFENLAKAAVAQTVFASNIYFWKESGYFEFAAEIQPLLHTWSLAVEEQFYLFFPPLIVLLSKAKSTRTELIAVGALVMLSLILSVWLTDNMPDAAFYLLPSRAWELGIGCWLAIYLEKPRYLSPSSSAILGTLGIIALIASFVFFSKHTPFPSYTALLPVCGSALLIFANAGTRSGPGVWLANGVVTRIGLLSYSLYLWHWPVLVYFHWAWGAEQSTLQKIVPLLLSLALAELSFRFVETPVRANRVLFTTRRLLATVAILAGASTALALVGLAKGNDKLIDPDGQISEFVAAANEPEPLRADCYDRVLHAPEDFVCHRINNSQSDRINVFVWGDSHASALSPVIDALATRNDWNVAFAIRGGCQPVLQMKRADFNRGCPEFNEKAMGYIAEAHDRIDLVMLVGSFSTGLRIGRFRSVNAPNAIDSESAYAEFDRHFAATIRRLNELSVPVVVFTEPPRYRTNPTDAFVRASIFGTGDAIPTVTMSSYEERIGRTYAIIDKSALLLRLDYRDIYCPNGMCRSITQNLPVTKDGSHLSVFGALMIIDALERDLAPLSHRAIREH